MGLPGALPVLNKKAVELAITLGLALNAAVQNKSIWDRKNYFYPDLPKGYQITQYAQPICLGGHLDITVGDTTKTIHINRIHLEEDAGKLLHSDDGTTLVDLNRAGVPLCEIVTEPCIHSPEEAAVFLKALRSLVRYTEVCDGNMEQGSLRCDANISLAPLANNTLGTKVEIKNLNSIKFIEKALKHEVQRQDALLSKGKAVVQETRLFDDAQGITLTMRSKEEAHDYRYFPDPDLVPLIIDETWINGCRSQLPELATARAQCFVRDFKLSEYDAVLLTGERKLADFFEKVVALYAQPKKVANWIMTELMRELNHSNKDITEIPVTPSHFAGLLSSIDEGIISATVAKKVFEEMFRTGEPPQDIIAKQNLTQIHDTNAIVEAITSVIAAHPEQVKDYQSGKEKVFAFLVGQVMRRLQGQANPQMVNDLLKKVLTPKSAC
ncbi:MAG: hypothetical protein ACD_62C00201G0004 [uncultured bacterium]|nr:MAG: hypothetical protein ACD_62C00201G0004 [uncultured bacterium]